MSKRYIEHQDTKYDAKSIYIEDTKCELGNDRFIVVDRIVPTMNELDDIICNLRGLVVQRDKQIKNLKTNNKHNLERKNRQIIELHAYEIEHDKQFVECQNDNERLQAKVKELEEENEEKNKDWQEEFYEMQRRENKNLAEIKKLKQQLQAQPKQILDEVEQAFTDYLPLKEKTGAGFYGKLNTIRKKYEGNTNEEN